MALVKFRSWVANSYVTILSDHESIQFWHHDLYGNAPTGRRARWHTFFSQFPLEIVYVPGSQNMLGDVMSRWAYPACEAAPDSTIHGSEEDAAYHAQEDLKERAWADAEALLRYLECEEDTRECAIMACALRAVHSADPPYLPHVAKYLVDQSVGPQTVAATEGAVRAGKATPEISILFEDWEPYYGECPVLKGRFSAIRAGRSNSSCQPLRPTFHIPPSHSVSQNILRSQGKILVPTVLTDRVIKACHTYAHAGIDKTLEMANRKFKFFQVANLYARVADVIRHCPVCEQAKPRVGKNPGGMHHWPIPDYPFSSLAMDFVELPPTKFHGERFDHIMVIVCRLTGYILAIPVLKAGFTAEDAASHFLHRCVFFMGLPKEIFSDNDKLFGSKFFETLMALSGIEQYKGVAYKPSTNGRAENAVKVLSMALKKYILQTKGSWVERLPIALFALNDLPGVIAPYSPHRLVFGRDPIGLGDYPAFVPSDGCVDAISFFQNVADERKEVKQKLTAIHNQIAQKFQNKFLGQNFVAGDRVWVANRKRAPGQILADKLGRIWQGPFEVIEPLPGNRFKVNTEWGVQVLPSERLKPYMPGKGQNPVPLGYYHAPDSPPVDDTYVVDAILGHKMVTINGQRHMRWKVKWRNHVNPTWEPASVFLEAVNSEWQQYCVKNKLKMQYLQ